VTVTRTTARSFVGANIKGTPKMRRRKVAQDLRTLRERADAYVVQEFKWRTYWLALAANLRPTAAEKWRVFPGLAKGAVRPVASGQAVGWRRSVWRSVDRRVALCHKGRAGISETRFMRAALLADALGTSLRCWHGTTHFVVGGDEPGDGPVRRLMLGLNLGRLARFLDSLAESGDPILFQLDANIHKGTDAYRRLVKIVEDRGGSFHGEHGVEYLFSIPGRNGVRVEPVRDFTVSPRVLNTDHEARGLTYRLVKEA